MVSTTEREFDDENEGDTVDVVETEASSDTVTLKMVFDGVDVPLADTELDAEIEALPVFEIDALTDLDTLADGVMRGVDVVLSEDVCVTVTVPRRIVSLTPSQTDAVTDGVVDFVVDDDEDTETSLFVALGDCPHERDELTVELELREAEAQPVTDAVDEEDTVPETVTMRLSEPDDDADGHDVPERLSDGDADVDRVLFALKEGDGVDVCDIDCVTEPVRVVDTFCDAETVDVKDNVIDSVDVVDVVRVSEDDGEFDRNEGDSVTDGERETRGDALDEVDTDIVVVWEKGSKACDRRKRHRRAKCRPILKMGRGWGGQGRTPSSPQRLTRARSLYHVRVARRAQAIRRRAHRLQHCMSLAVMSV